MKQNVNAHVFGDGHYKQIDLALVKNSIVADVLYITWNSCHCLFHRPVQYDTLLSGLEHFRPHALHRSKSEQY